MSHSSLRSPEPAGRRSLSANVAANIFNVVVVVGTSLLAVPLLIDRLGIAGYGLWTLVQTIVIYVSMAELGLGPAIARFTSIGLDHPDRPRQVLSTALVVYTFIGFVIVGACQLLAPAIADLFTPPQDLRDGFVASIRIVGWVCLAALVGGALGHVLQGMERFRAYTFTSLAGSLAFIVFLIVLMDGGARLEDAAYATLIQWSLVAVIRVAVLRRMLFGRGPRRLGRDGVREIAGFSVRLQAAVFSSLLNTQTDRVIVGAVSSAATLGQVGVATQVADAGRFLTASTFTPLAARMAVTYGSQGRAALDEMHDGIRRMWLIGLLGGMAVGVGAARPAITAWLGSGHDTAAVYACVLIVAYGIGLLPGPAFAYLRAVGNPALEGRFGLVTVMLNVAITVPMAVVAGATGVICATAAAYLLSTVWVLRRAADAVPGMARDSIDLWKQMLTLLAMAGGCYGAGQAMVAGLPRLIALGGLGAFSLTVFGVYVTVASGHDLRAVASRWLQRGHPR